MSRPMLLFVSLLALFLNGCQSSGQKTLTQVSTIDALLAGAYDGRITCGQLLRYGDTGIGTFDKLDGEMILLDGKFYQAKADGSVARADNAVKTPFAAAVFFKAQNSVSIREPVDFGLFRKTVDSMQKNPNLFTAVRAHGHFKNIKVRSVPAQGKPYKPLAEVTGKQAEFTYSGISGTLAGFKCPPFVKGVNVPGFHVHFLSDDFKAGGHVLSFEMDRGVLETAAYSEFFMILPDSDELFAGADMSKDSAAELEKAEK